MIILFHKFSFGHINWALLNYNSEMVYLVILPLYLRFWFTNQDMMFHEKKSKWVARDRICILYYCSTWTTLIAMAYEARMFGEFVISMKFCETAVGILTSNSWWKDACGIVKFYIQLLLFLGCTWFSLLQGIWW